jgi:hypothetical protein
MIATMPLRCPGTQQPRRIKRPYRSYTIERLETVLAYTDDLMTALAGSHEVAGYVAAEQMRWQALDELRIRSLADSAGKAGTR